MKMCLVCAAILQLALFSAHAEEKVKDEIKVPINKEQPKVWKQKPEDISKPKETGVIFMMSERGLEIFSPTADPELGKGEKTLTEPFLTEQPIGEEVERKQFGGIKIFGWLF